RRALRLLGTDPGDVGSAPAGDPVALRRRGMAPHVAARRRCGGVGVSDAFDLLGAQRAVFRSSLSAAEKLVLLAMLDHWSRRETEPFPSVPKLEDWTSLGRTTVIEAIKALERGDVLKVKREVGKPNRYDFSGVCPGSLPVRQSDQSATRTRPSGEPHPSATRTEPVRQADPKEPRKEPKKEPRGSARTRRPSWRKVPEDWQPKPEHRALAAE